MSRFPPIADAGGLANTRSMIHRLFATAFLLLAAFGLAAPAQAKSLPNGVEITSPQGSMQVTALSDNILRVRVAHGAWPEDASWAVPAAVRAQRVAVQATDDGFRTAALAVHVDPATLGLSVTDLQGHTILADAPGAVRFDGRGFTLSKALPISQH